VLEKSEVPRGFDDGIGLSTWPIINNILQVVSMAWMASIPILWRVWMPSRWTLWQGFKWSQSSLGVRRSEDPVGVAKNIKEQHESGPGSAATVDNQVIFASLASPPIPLFNYGDRMPIEIIT